jgi:UPF0716 family protein affecting phage T7 exclusion
MLLIIPYFLLELYFSLAVGSEIGFLGSVIWILTTFMVGMALLKNAHISIIQSFVSLDNRSFHDATATYLLGAILLIIPGVFSDFLGVTALLYSLFLQLGGTIPSIKNKINIKKSNEQGDNNVIDVEIIECHTNSNSRS